MSGVKREIRDYIEDVLDAMDKAMSFVSNMSFDEFTKDDKSAFAVIRAIEIIGEAVKKVPLGVRKKYLNIPWREMAGMRDKMIHGYFGVDAGIVWETVKTRIPAIQPLFKRVLNDLNIK